MNKLFSMLIVICLLLSMAGCSMLQYESMSMEKILDLPDDEMIVALLMQLGMKPFEYLSESEKVVYTAAAFEMEVLNGGTVQFLANEADSAAPYVLEALEKIGATEHLTLLKDQLDKTSVDLTNLSDFVTDDMEKFSALYDRYNFDPFDNEYENLTSMPKLIRSYVQTHFEDFGG